MSKIGANKTMQAMVNNPVLKHQEELRTLGRRMGTSTENANVFWNKIHEKSSTEARQLDFPWSNKSVLNIGSKLPDIPNNHITHLSDCVGIATQALQNNDFDYVFEVNRNESRLQL